MDYSELILVLASAGAFFMAFNNGANDVANAFASAVGSKAISMRLALALASVVTFLGALTLGGHVAGKLIDGVMNPTEFGSAAEYITAMLCVLLASGVFIFMATLTGLPVSSSHSIVGSLVGVSVLVAGWGAVNWPLIGFIALSWVVSPILAGALCALICKAIQYLIIRDGGAGTLKRVLFWLPVLVSLIFAIAVWFIFQKIFDVHKIVGAFMDVDGYEGWFIDDVIVALVLFVALYVWLRSMVKNWLAERQDNGEGAEKAFAQLQVATSSYVAFGIGANDVANSISPVFAITVVISQSGIPDEFAGSLPFWVLLLGGIGMATGISLLGNRVMKTLGDGVTKINNSRGFSIDFSVASTVVGASSLGIPVSTTHAATGAVVGSGLSSGQKVDFKVLLKIVSAWLVTLPAAALITIVLYLIADLIFLG